MARGLVYSLAFSAIALMTHPVLEARPVGFDHSQPRVYSVQLAAGADLYDTEEVAAQFRELGLRDVRVEETDTLMFRVLYGRFSLYADAMVVKNSFRTSGVAPDAFLKEYKVDDFETTAAEWQTSPVAGLPDSMRMFPELLKQKDNHLSVSDRTEYENLEAIDKAGADAEYREALLQHNALTPSGDPLSGYIAINLAILDIKAGDYESALPHLLNILEGKTTSTRVHQMMALRRYAWVKHQQGDRPEAYHGYCELYDLATGARSRSIAQVDRLGLLMELAESMKGTHYEVRAAKAAWQPHLPEKAYSSRATMDLIEQESWFRQPQPYKDIKKAVALSEATVRRYEGLGDERPDREYFMALWEAGHYSVYAPPDLEKAEYYFERVLEEAEGIEMPTFAGLNPKAQSLIGLGRVAKQRGDRKTHREYINMVLEHFPETDIAKKILENRANRPMWIEMLREKWENEGEEGRKKIERLERKLKAQEEEQ